VLGVKEMLSAEGKTVKRQDGKTAKRQNFAVSRRVKPSTRDAR
jgi:hypothetical protein